MSKELEHYENIFYDLHTGVVGDHERPHKPAIKGVRQRIDALIKPDGSLQLKLPRSGSLLALPSST